ncbi:inositol monophosphatase family protein [Companilactobacillus versmoldensis]|uniref:Fructose-1 6-bisphosphatase n=1 Tax=Companilactobacillus versmoldensis DSM 14857 = KCTC 3814 TaxID=1423815 RepID=A0A0R1SJW1_9LACO|nr:inositol monophosphatase family protein [Companilactobacillus versmoldensis]KRL67876.1 fructose-1 6-bisphosphatase [Companilactobacillus versmoldensis DSM 14857 = KCTC 3814]
MKEKSQEIDNFLVGLLHDVVSKLVKEVKMNKNVNTKSGPNDLVTNFDKSTEKGIVEIIKEHYPDSSVVSEEGFGDDIKSMSGLVFFVDPIDGTMNFVKCHDSFASMVGVYLDGEPFVGAIINVMQDKIYHGGPELGVFENDQRLSEPINQELKEGLVVISGPMVLKNYLNTQDVVGKSSGIRIFGCAGIVFEHLLTGKEIIYMSYLKPWDLAAGRVLCESLGLSVARVDEKPVDMLQSQVVIAGTKKAVSEVLKTVKI